MATKDVTVQVDQLAYDFAEALVKFVGEAKTAITAAGDKPLMAVAPVLTAVLSDLLPLVGQFSQLPGEYAANKEMCIKAVNLVAFDLADVLLKK